LSLYGDAALGLDFFDPNRIRTSQFNRLFNLQRFPTLLGAGKMDGSVKTCTSSMALDVHLRSGTFQLTFDYWNAFVFIHDRASIPGIEA
jgi:hypothetical protein